VQEFKDKQAIVNKNSFAEKLGFIKNTGKKLEIDILSYLL
jgi:hypothetical protein